MDLLHDAISLSIVGESACGPQNALTLFPGGLHDRDLHLDLLAFGHTEVFVQFDGLAVDSAVNRFRHE